ncbi:DUF1428 family protein [Streptomyces clavuligerus]|uniref:DUF1428 domain-containing protein n=1 Tax=Streptomyces clavuligerus TaxID=1901 RepID=B5GYT2_STRCL|nr:DUF1428 family protein [Streptomyces clavuligerus]ANW22590.1 hypothetical protein BB341_30255 [Streptomyces clavuligerus]AXU16940.1 DUF1428 family protein [Streptomyces clavuligerus]EDY51478.1 hypothetical protein SSCG_04683 [Streptomyces clavuligerus]EFG04724.1 Hypothetical protein SCLAV_p1238 [Streptomyces clavuligerus]MBY6306830.1 DUF1428 family protein [Streptomyces clavuligerus]
MYLVVYLHRVPRSREEVFRAVVHRANEVFRRHGAIGATLLEMSDPRAKYGCSGLLDGVDLTPDEVLYVELNHFHDRAHFEEVMPKVDIDPELEELYKTFVETLDTSRILRGEFSTVFELFNPAERERYQQTPHAQWEPAHQE